MARWGQGATSTRALEGAQRACARVCAQACTDRYLGAMPGQNLPLAAGQRDLLLDGALELVWKERQEKGLGALRSLKTGRSGASSPMAAGFSRAPTCQVPVCSLCVPGQPRGPFPVPPPMRPPRPGR